MASKAASTVLGRLGAVNTPRSTTCAVAAVATSVSRHGYASSSANVKPVERITVIGSGLMGAGVVQVAAQSGFKVSMVDLTDDSLRKGEKIITSSLKRVAKKKFGGDVEGAEARKYIDDIMSRITLSKDSGAAARDSQLVIEAIVENLKTKRALFKALDEAASASTIFASRQAHFAGLHFFNPVPQMKLVEVIRTPETVDAVFDSLVAVTKKMGKIPVACKDTPGFVVNRLLVPYMMESLRLVERGDASMQDVDTAMKLGAGYPLGPFELMDYVGLDTIKHITDGWYQSGEGLKGDKLIAPSALLEKHVKAGKLGRKSGEGFYTYDGVGADKRKH
ncbi:3-hydroxyacyl-CoA dehydrogenase [Fimicolochytrium jonesii]|uniref:3-hydroxyacyl-CoA dehydrogenase n=1 Tax=Fimicolochytrium jonesii TaxID=1396493 RepID=UPI0022FEB834|nr:3-hydroxyacyl-CoA dehydrogenase [Fimicolochytrium jonesii]KAI8821662.1 3-hydroxyacyl-CoA dehydrogenase [Fimicolochytrium jonesii]